MLRYETLLLTRTEVTEDELSAIEKSFDKIVTEGKGTLQSFDKWGKYRLCYPIKKNTHGIYTLVRFQLPPSSLTAALKELDTYFKIKCNETVIRNVTVKLAPNAPSTYQRPDAMEMGRTGSLDNFLKDNKIENLLSSVDTAKRSSGRDDNDIDDSEMA